MSDRDAPWVELLSDDWSGPLRLRVRGRSMWPTLRPGDQVTVERAAADALRAGDWALLRGPRGLFLHRFLGFTREGLLLTKGDGHRAPDLPWPPQALVGRAVILSRQGRDVPISPTSLRERVCTVAHRLLAAAWPLLRRIGLLILLLAAIPAVARAAVSLVSFEATSQVPVIRITWETASETNMSGFYVQRASQEAGEYQRVSGLVPAEGDIIGAFYVYTDTDVIMDHTYYYRLEAVESGGDLELYGPVSVTLSLPPTATPTPTPTNIPTPRPRAEPPTMTPTPIVPATVTPIPVSPAAIPSASPIPTARPTAAPMPSPSPTRLAVSVEIPPTVAPTVASAPAEQHVPTPGFTLTATSSPTPTETPAGVSQFPALSSSPPPSPPPLALVPSATPRVGRAESPPSFACVWPLALVLAGYGLLLLGGWWLWWTGRRAP